MLTVPALVLLAAALAAPPVHGHVIPPRGDRSQLATDELPDAAEGPDVAGALEVTDPPQPAAALQDGDLVFQRSRSAQARAIALATGSPWTHVGLVRLREGRPWVLEAVQPVRWTPFDTWASRGRDQQVVVRRHAEARTLWTPEALARLDALAQAWVGRDYDAHFTPGDETLYCSELVREAWLGAVGIELAELRPVSSYQVDDPALRDAMVRRWGRVPEALPVVAPSDLLDAPGLVEVAR